MDTLFAMRVFQQVAATLSFTEAGQWLGLAPSSVSRQIDALEAALGAKLLSRSTRKLALTEAGALYRQEVDAILQQVQDAHAAVAAHNQLPQGRLKLSAPPTLGYMLVAPLLLEFLERYPLVQAELSVSNDYVDLQQTDTDVAIRVGPLAESMLISRTLGPYRRVLCASPAYLARHAPLTRPEQLSAHSCLIYRYGAEKLVWEFADPGSEHPIRIAPAGVICSNDSAVLHLSCMAGAGVARLPYWLVREDLAAGRLVTLLDAFPMTNSEAADTEVHLVYLPSRRAAAKVQAFVEFARQYAQGRM